MNPEEGAIVVVDDEEDDGCRLEDVCFAGALSAANRARIAASPALPF